MADWGKNTFSTDTSFRKCRHTNANASNDNWNDIKRNQDKLKWLTFGPMKESAVATHMHSSTQTHTWLKQDSKPNVTYTRRTRGGTRKKKGLKSFAKDWTIETSPYNTKERAYAKEKSRKSAKNNAGKNEKSRSINTNIGSLHFLFVVFSFSSLALPLDGDRSLRVLCTHQVAFSARFHRSASLFCMVAVFHIRIVSCSSESTYSIQYFYLPIRFCWTHFYLSCTTLFAAWKRCYLAPFVLLFIAVLFVSTLNTPRWWLWWRIICRNTFCYAQF